MRVTWAILLSTILFVGCESDILDYKVWQLKRAQVSAFARIDSSQLLLEVFNPSTPNAISLSQSGLQGDFEVAIWVNALDSDTLLTPQFRLEVFDEQAETETKSGVAVNPDVVFCYAGGTEAENRDIRMINDHGGSMHIYRSADTIRCAAEFGEVSLSYADVVTDKDLTVRLVFGSTNSGSGMISTRVDNFRAFMPWNSNISGAPVRHDEFEIESW